MKPSTIGCLTLIAVLSGCSSTMVVTDAETQQEMGLARIDYSLTEARLVVSIDKTDYIGLLDDGGNHEDHKTSRVIPFKHEIDRNAELRSVDGRALRCQVSSRSYGNKGRCLTEDGEEITLRFR